MRCTTPACSSNCRLRYALLCARPGCASRISGIVSGRPAEAKASTSVLRVGVARCPARRRRAATASWSGSSAVMVRKCRSRSRVPPARGYGPRVDITERFVAVVQQPDDEIALDEAALLIAAHDHPVDVDEQLRALDALATEIGDVDAPALAYELFVARGFAGNMVDYGDPRHSYLDVVLERRRGLPITLNAL